MAVAEQDVVMTSASRHPMVTRRRQGLHDIFQGVSEEQIHKLRQAYTSQRSTSSRKSRLSSSGDDEGQKRTETLDDVTNDTKHRRKLGRGGGGGVTSGRVTKVTAAPRRRKHGVVYPEGHPKDKITPTPDANGNIEEQK